MSSFRRYASFYSAVAAAVLTLPTILWLRPELSVQATANVFFIVYLMLEFRKFRTLTPEYLRKHVATTDEPAWVIVAVTFVAVMVAVGSLFVLINEGGKPGALDLVLALTSVALGWISIHTMTALHYAHLYWRPAGTGGAIRQGLDFPGDDDPGGYDFLYYALVIGMTAQTADVNITRTGMRKLTLIHGVVSFFFNTVLVAAAVNVAVALAAG
jgi:uncharacterized membrane protein